MFIMSFISFQFYVDFGSDFILSRLIEDFFVLIRWWKEDGRSSSDKPPSPFPNGLTLDLLMGDF